MELRNKVKKCLEDYYETNTMPERCDEVQKELYEFLKNYSANYRHESKQFWISGSPESGVGSN